MLPASIDNRAYDLMFNSETLGLNIACSQQDIL